MIGDMPDIAVSIVKSGEAPSGVGEPGRVAHGTRRRQCEVFATTGGRVAEPPMTKAESDFVRRWNRKGSTR